jgi:2-desacetyl-2-hydroxyethyl bacteriochlorophyllide A dehydrogenase
VSNRFHGTVALRSHPIASTIDDERFTTMSAGSYPEAGPAVTALPTTATAIRFDRRDTVGLGSHPLPACRPSDLVVETLYSMISPGTELRMLAGHYGAAEQFPYVPGYNSIARVIAVGPEAAGFRVGDLVSAINPRPNGEITALYGAHASHQVLATDTDQRPVLLPEGADPRQFALTEIASIAYRGVSAARPRPGETAIVIGRA